MGKIVASNEADVGLTWASDKQKYVGTKPVSAHAETALLLAKLKTKAQKADHSKCKGLFVYGKEGSDVYKITL